jgi:hypothetical protein
LEKIGPEEVKVVRDDLSESEKYLLKLMNDLKVGAIIFFYPNNVDMSKVRDGTMSPEEMAHLDEVVEHVTFSPMRLRAWFLLKTKGAISLRTAQRQDSHVYLELLKLMEFGLVKKVKTGSGFIAINENVFRDRMIFLLSKEGEKIWEEFGCPE